jgi:hypothetical protein
MLKMRRYYANSILTLTSINTSLEEELNKIGVSRQPINPKLGTEVVN